ncbi:MAG TPA: HlyD family efflux transporter periplasmic adaptor subunit [Candidatus Aminicenantes bacterium]|nr:HlyD family efflux transporter periplasmic adaptor subunit [Candidatus Aminicenantes bacterium]
MKVKMKSQNTVRMLLILFLVVTSAAVFMQCSNEPPRAHTETDENEHEETEHAEEVVRLSDEEINEFGIELAVAGPGQLEQYVDLTGEIVIDPDRLAHIFPRFPGIVKEVRKKIGDPVKRGEVLAIIESNESLSPYAMKSLINGEVIDMHLTPGEVVSGGGHAFTIADLSKVWVNLNIYQKDLPDIEVGQKVIINAPPDARTATGLISYISPVVSKETRTATARVVLENEKHAHIWRPGLFVNGRVIAGENMVPLLVPQSAVTTFEDQDVVFVKHEDGFKPLPVKIGRVNAEKAAITAGLKAGQVYVAEGAFTLKSELRKKSFGGHHH